MSEARAQNPVYLRFRLKLEAATQFDAIEYSCWVHDHRDQLRAGFRRSGELNAAVYCRMQYARCRNGGLL
jgi:hypothetical protein